MSRGFRHALVAIMLVIASATATSGATYTASSDNAQAFTAAADFGLHVEMTDPGPTMRGSRSMSATPTSTDGIGISSVRIERSPAGAGSWTTICTIASAPWSCILDTTTLTDGLYDFRAIATNANGYTRRSAVVGDRRVDNTAPSITQADPGAWFRGTLTLSTTTLSDGGGSGVTSVSYQYKTSLLGTWTTACTANSAPFECPFATGSLGNGTAYDFRAIATDQAGNTTTSATLTNRKPDNAAPTGTVLDPGLNLTGLVSLVTTAVDLHSGLASVAVQHAPTGTGSWSNACVVSDLIALSCTWDTSLLNGFHDLRAVVTDVAGNTYTTPTVSGRRVDNTAPATTITVPAGTLSGTAVAFSATADDGTGSGVKNVAFQRAPSGGSTWTNLCTPDTTAAYTCTWNSTTVGDALYDFRSLATDNVDLAGSSAPVQTRRVDNSNPSAADVQTANGGATAGVIEAGDSITLTYSEEIDPTSIIAGWDGTGSRAIYVTGSHHNQGDRLMFLSSVSPYPALPLATSPGVNLDEDYFANNSPAWAATLTRSGSSFTVTFGALVQGGPVSTTPATPGTMNWFPSSGCRDFVAKACLTTQRGETGSLDREF